jgi:hypothetical protein
MENKDPKKPETEKNKETKELFKVQKLLTKRTYIDMKEQIQERPQHSETTVARGARGRTFGVDMTFSATVNSDLKTSNARKYQCR